MGSDRVHRRVYTSFPCFIFKLGIEHMGNHYIIPYIFFFLLKYVVRILKVKVQQLVESHAAIKEEAELDSTPSLLILETVYSLLCLILCTSWEMLKASCRNCLSRKEEGHLEST